MQAKLLRNGFHICSSRDPVREGERWARDLSEASLDVESMGRVIVIGGGAGHHVAALLRMRPLMEALIFDPNLDFRDHFFSMYPELRSRVEWSASAQELCAKKNLRLRSFSFRPAWQGAQTEFIEALGKFKRAQLEETRLDRSSSQDDDLLFRVIESCVRYSESKCA